eukprot:GDKH01004986.1.p1 GENE.GDKH01004986.1~~GDKH01004986.1.p1  ORF type:complete len:115 (+),score=8.82 GDKH01004986.1:90-434(+)
MWGQFSPVGAVRATQRTISNKCTRQPHANCVTQVGSPTHRGPLNDHAASLKRLARQHAESARRASEHIRAQPLPSIYTAAGRGFALYPGRRRLANQPTVPTPPKRRAANALFTH